MVPYEDYELVEYIGAGKIGMVYRAESKRTGLVFACKVIREGGLKEGWQRELEKVRKLQGVPYVVEYHNYGSSFDRQNRPYSWVLFDYVDGKNLRDQLVGPDFILSMPFIEGLLRTILDVLHACCVVGISHGDLHAGNILIKKPDPRIRNNKPTVYVSDFGYGERGSAADLNPTSLRPGIVI